MELYVGNNTGKSVLFYRSAEDRVPVRIEPGCQALVDLPKFERKDFDALIAHNAKYGMADAKDAGENHGLVYSTDGPIAGLSQS